MSFFSKSKSALFLLTAIICGGCTTTTEEPDDNFGRIRLRRPDNVVYQNISSAGCELDVPVDLHAVAGTSTTMEVQLINGSSRKLQIHEWYMIDQYNFSIFYRRHPADRPIDYIKYDVEGAEYEALEGSKNTVLRDRPVLAVSLYHRPEDLFRIPLYIHSLNPAYRFYLRRTKCLPAWEIMLYAV